MHNNSSRNNSNQLAKKLVAVGFRHIELVEFDTFFEINEP